MTDLHLAHTLHMRFNGVRNHIDSRPAPRWLPLLLLGILLAPGRVGAQSVPAEIDQSAPVDGKGAKIAVLPIVNVSELTDGERADGPVTGYRATRSATFTRIDMPLKDVPASVTVVPAILMKDQAMQNLADVFRYVPGVLTHQGEGNRDQVILRGNSTTADFFVDGTRDDAQVFRDLYNLERVEVLKGPGGMIFGRGGAGGVVNRVTKRPAFDAISAGTMTVGSWDQRRATFDVGNKFGNQPAAGVAWRVNAMDERAGSFRNGFELTRYALNPAISWLASVTTLLTVAYERQNDERTADRGIPSQNGRPYETDPGTFFGNAAQSHARSTTDTLSAVLDHDLGGGTQVRNSFRATHYDKFYQNVYPGSAVNAVGNMTLSAYNNANQRTNIFNQTDLTGKRLIDGIEHSWLAGLEVGHQRSDSIRNTGFFGNATSATVSAGAPFAVASRFVQNGTDANSAVWAAIVAIYLQDQIAMSPEWRLLAGVRVDRFKVNFDDRRTTTTPTDLARTENGTSPRIGAIWTPTADTTWYASYSYAFLPSAEQLGLATTTADLGPETANNMELGARWNMLPALTLSTAVFRLERNDVRVADPLRAGYFIKTGQLRTGGVEISLHGDVTRQWQVFGGYSHLNGRVTQPINSGTTASVATIIPAGNKIGLVPGNTLSLWNRYNFNAVWSVGLGLVYQSASFTSINNSVTIPAFSRADAAMYYTFAGGKTRLSLNIENLADRKYYPTVDGDNNISPGAPRNARATLSMAF